MIDDMETEVDLLERQRKEAWRLLGCLEGSFSALFFYAVVMSLMLIAALVFGYQAWILAVACTGALVSIPLSAVFKSHFSKKYMRLANGE